MEFNVLSKLLTAMSLLVLLTSCASDEGGSDSRIVISTGDTIIPLNDLQYQLPLVVQVADDIGSPLPNTQVSLRLTTISYSKGRYEYNENWFKTLETLNFASCAAEDVNGNNILDAGEDINSNGLLDPETPSITPHPDESPTLLEGTSTLITDDNGFGYFTVSYPKTEASWVNIRITATAKDGLSENKGVIELELFTLQADHEPEDDAPAFVWSPYGLTGNCADDF